VTVPKGWVETEGTVSSVQSYQARGVTFYTVVFTYKVDGHYCGGTYTTTEEYREGDSLPLSYDPKDPDRNNLVRREGMLHWFYVVFFVFLGIMAIWLFLQPKAK
jgi:Protein of unknown function (DUF3592)